MQAAAVLSTTGLSKMICGTLMAEVVKVPFFGKMLWYTDYLGCS